MLFSENANLSLAQAGAVLIRDARDTRVTWRIRPDLAVIVAGVSRGVIVAERINDIRQVLMLPADENVAGAGVIFDHVCYAIGVVARAGRVYRKA